ncbi:MAG: MFS transporter [Chloroflexi bacterium]|nr:MFS transporter [Chloroflexota bacterium]
MQLRNPFVSHKTLAVFLATIILLELAHGIELIALFPLYLSSVMHEGADVVGATLSSFLVADIVTRTPAGTGADRWGRKPLLVTGVLLSAAPLLVMPRVESPSLFLALNALNGIGAGCVWPAIYAAVADSYERERYGLVLGVVNMVMLGGIAIGPIVGGLLLSRVSYASAFNVCLAIVVLALALVLFFVRTPRSRQDDGTPLPGPQVWNTLVRRVNPTLVRLLVVGLLLALALGMMLPLVSLFGRDVLRISPDVFALVLIPPGIITAALIVPAGHWADRRGRYTPLVAGLGLMAIPFAGAPLSVDPIAVSAGATLAGIGYALLVPAWNALVMDWVPSSARGLFLGAVAAAQGIGLAVGPSVGGLLWARVNVYAPFEAAAALLAAAIGLSVWDARMVRAAGAPGLHDSRAGEALERQSFDTLGSRNASARDPGLEGRDANHDEV